MTIQVFVIHFHLGYETRDEEMVDNAFTGNVR